MKKKLTSTALAITLLAGAAAPAFAEGTTSTTTDAGTAVTSGTTTTAPSASTTTDSSTTTNSTTTTGTTTTGDTSATTGTTTSGDTSATTGTSTTGTNGQAVDPSSITYKLQDLLTQLKLLFAFNDQAKVDLLVQEANAKLQDLQTLDQANKAEYNEKLIETINQTLEKAQDILKEAKVEAEKDEDSAAKTQIEEKEDSTVKVQKHSLEVLKALLAKVPEHGKKGIANAIAKQEAKLKQVAQTQPVAPTTNTTAAQDSSTTAAQDQSSTQTATQNQQSSTSTQSSTTSDASTTVQAPSVQANETVKHDNGLHLGQLKNKDKQNDSKDEDREHEGNNGHESH